MDTTVYYDCLIILFDRLFYTVFGTSLLQACNHHHVRWSRFCNKRDTQIQASTNKFLLKTNSVLEIQLLVPLISPLVMTFVGCLCK